MESKQVILMNTEEFKFEKIGEGKEQKIIISGQAMPLKEMSRNGVFYRDESVKKAYKSLEKCAFLFNHDTNQPKGHVVSTEMTEGGITYKADIDPEEKDFIRKVERGDIRHVSVGCMVEKPDFNEEEGTITVDVKEFVELSSVPVPGFKNTSANKEGAMFLAESFGNTEFLDKLKETAKGKPEDGSGPNPDCDKKKDKEEAEDEDEDKPEDKKEAEDEKDKDKEEPEDKEKPEDEKEEVDPEKKPEDEEAEDEKDKDKDKDKEESLTEEIEPETEPTPEEKMNTLNSKVEDLFSKFDEVVNRLAILESKVDTMNDSEEAVESKEEKVEPSPDTTETFETNKILPKSADSVKLKEEAFKAEPTKKKEVNMNKVRLENSY